LSRPAGHAVAARNAFENPSRAAPPSRFGGATAVSRRETATADQKGRSKMPKMKTKSSAKKRFKVTATGKIKAQAAGKRHGMIKRTAKFVRTARGTMVLNDSDAKIVKKYMPYAR
jgi:large subunit ribosomal protein L35